MSTTNEHNEAPSMMNAREGIPTGETVKLTAEQEAARKKRNVAIAIGLVSFMVIIMVVTMLRISQNIAASSAG
jgi:hypothetical protein